MKITILLMMLLVLKMIQTFQHRASPPLLSQAPHPKLKVVDAYPPQPTGVTVILCNCDCSLNITGVKAKIKGMIRTLTKTTTTTTTMTVTMTVTMTLTMTMTMTLTVTLTMINDHDIVQYHIYM